MEDRHIVALFWQRCETAIAETAMKYGQYLKSISFNILYNYEDAQECVNDTYNDAWGSMPPHRPEQLATYLGKITRRISIDRWRYRNAAKRGGGEIPLALDELRQCVAHKESLEEQIIHKELISTLNHFLKSLPRTECQIFMCRYWYLDSIEAIATRFQFSQSKVTSTLFRTRKKLRILLEKEGY